MSLSWDEKWTWNHPDFYIFPVSYERMNGNCLHSEQSNWQYRFDGVASRGGGAHDRFRTGRYAAGVCCVMLLPLLLTPQVGSSSPSVASPTERDSLVQQTADVRTSSDVRDIKGIQTCRHALPF